MTFLGLTGLYKALNSQPYNHNTQNIILLPALVGVFNICLYNSIDLVVGLLPIEFSFIVIFDVGTQ